MVNIWHNFLSRADLIVLRLNSKKKKKKRGGKASDFQITKIDSAFIKKSINGALNCVTIFSFEDVSSNHRRVATKIRLNLRKNKKQKKSLILFTNPSAPAVYDTRSIFKRSLTGLNSEFFLLLDELPHQG